MIIGAFAGPGGWCVAAARLGLAPSVGIELDAATCATRAAAGHLTIRADVAAFPVDRLAGRVTGGIFSPPCTTFSSAGNRAGNAVTDVLDASIRDAFAGCPTRAAHRREMAAMLGKAWWPSPKLTRAQRSAKIWPAVRSASLVVEPARFIAACRPEWVALEQVPAVLPLWRVYADELQKLGYSTWHGILNAADYGIIAPCPLHSPSFPNVNADCVGPHSQYETALVSAGGPATTSPGAESLRLAATVMGRWARAIRQAFAGAATCAAREQALVALAESVPPTTPPGPAVAAWTTEVTSTSGLTPVTAASIASLLSRFLEDLSPAEKLSITSTKIQRTTVQLISKSIAATLITGPGTGPASRTAGCGLCVDVATPQTRQRAILVASRVRKVSRPTPTHYDPRKGAQLFGSPWVSMADALGWGASARPGPSVTAGGTATGGAEPLARGGREALEAARDTGQWVLRTGNNSELGDGSLKPYERSVNGPAPTFAAGDGGKWSLRTSFGQPAAGPKRTGSGSHGTHEMNPAARPSHAVTTKAKDWTLTRPATTVQGDPRIGHPGHKDREGGESQFAQDSVRITVAEAAVLQSFPAEYPWCGTKTKQFEQVGNAIPPLLAEHVLAMAAGTARRSEAAA